METVERNLALALMLEQLEASLAVFKGLEQKVFGITDEGRRELDQKLCHVTAAISDTIHAVSRMLSSIR